jgi:hypothetical protein
MSSDPARPAGPMRAGAPPPARIGPAPGGRAALLAAAVLALTACGVRLETPPPPPPTPDAAEILRQRTVADALLLQELAATTDHPDPAVQVVVDAVEEAAGAHVDALGGVYDPGTGPDEPAPDPAEGASAPSPGGAPSPTDGSGTPQADDADGPDPAGADDAVGLLAATLTGTAETALASADEAADGPLARLLGAVAANRLVLGERLTAAVDGPDGAVGTRTAAWDVVDPDPGALPPGLAEPSAVPLVTAEDLAGQAWEVVAARRDGDSRAAAADRAAAHRARAQAWAEAAAVAGSGLDPRRTSYALPAGVLSGDAGAAASDLAALETRLADAYASLVAQADPGARGPLVAASADAAAAAAALTGDVPVLPGMPEHAG